MRLFYLCAVLLAMVVLSGCAAPKVKLFPDATEPLREFTLEGKKKGKVLIVSVRGIISGSPRQGLLSAQPSMVQEIVGQLKRAEQDKQIKAVLLKIDSPGGTVTASDVLYHEIMAFKSRSKAKVVVMMMNVAASGGYYMALPADYIMAHPTSVTGSIGVIFMRPQVADLMGKIGVDVEVSKSGENKDMGSPFRRSTDQEQEIMQDLTDAMGDRFLELVAQHRTLTSEALADVATARIYLAEEARKLGLVDEVGYLSDAVTKAKSLAELPADAKVVVYRRTRYADDNWYNDAVNQVTGPGAALVKIDWPVPSAALKPGFYYLWTAGAGN